MQAIRQSPNPLRTLDAFWSGQLTSKDWLVRNLSLFVNRPVTVDICGGWVGTLASMIFQSDIIATRIRSIDIDPECQPIATMMNKGEEIVGKFFAITADMCNTELNADVIINTSCEHITQEQYEMWRDRLPKTSLIVLQSNNYDIPEHVRIAKTLDEFKSQSSINVMWSGELDLPLYKRFMIIGNRI